MGVACEEKRERLPSLPGAYCYNDRAESARKKPEARFSLSYPEMKESECLLFAQGNYSLGSIIFIDFAGLNSLQVNSAFPFVA